jgi:hypothetical protein
METEAAAKRARRLADSGFLQLLRSHTPDITEASSYEEVAEALGDEEGWQVGANDITAETAA